MSTISTGRVELDTCGTRRIHSAVVERLENSGADSRRSLSQAAFGDLAVGFPPVDAPVASFVSWIRTDRAFS